MVNAHRSTDNSFEDLPDRSSLATSPCDNCAVKDRDIYENTSPVKYIRYAKAPLLVLQDENDIRVPKGQAEQAVAILKQQGAEVDAHYYAGEGHGFAEIRRTIAWFDKYLKSERDPRP